MKKKIIIIEDDQVIREELKHFLNKYGYDVVGFTDFENILARIEEEKGDLILLDINLPVFDGYTICREVRQTSEIPIIIVTSRDSDVDELMSMHLGADDFITKPYNTQILLAHIASILKRTYGSQQGASSSLLTYGDLELNLSNASIIHQGNQLELTKNEVKILSYLITHQGEIVSRDALMSYLWKADYFVDDSTLSVNVTRLRKKLESVGMQGTIETRRGLGYIMP
ncbi:MAG: response regulator transcription factor [Cellulosilyticaceae bacterium]